MAGQLMTPTDDSSPAEVTPLESASKVQDQDAPGFYDTAEDGLLQLLTDTSSLHPSPYTTLDLEVLCDIDILPDTQADPMWVPVMDID